MLSAKADVMRLTGFTCSKDKGSRGSVESV